LERFVLKLFNACACKHAKVVHKRDYKILKNATVFLACFICQKENLGAFTKTINRFMQVLDHHYIEQIKQQGFVL